MTRDDYTGESLDFCEDCGRLKWLAAGERKCSDCDQEDAAEPEEETMERTSMPAYFGPAIPAVRTHIQVKEPLEFSAAATFEIHEGPNIEITTATENDHRRCYLAVGNAHSNTTFARATLTSVQIDSLIQRLTEARAEVVRYEKAKASA